MCESRFYFCGRCGNLVGLIHGTGVSPVCCGEEMAHLNPQMQENGCCAPQVDVSDGTVCVSFKENGYPSSKKHGVLWFYMQTDRGGQRKCLAEGDEPVVRFALCDEKPTAVYAYCDKHGLRKTAL